MKKASGVIMIIGIVLSLLIYWSDAGTKMSAVQEIQILTVSIITLIGFYVLGRALENFSNTDNSEADNNE